MSREVGCFIMAVTYTTGVPSGGFCWPRLVGDGGRGRLWAASGWAASSRFTDLDLFDEGCLPRRGSLSSSRSTPVPGLCAPVSRESHERISNTEIRRLPLQTYFQVALNHQSRSPCPHSQLFVVPSLHQLWNVERQVSILGAVRLMFEDDMTISYARRDFEVGGGCAGRASTTLPNADLPASELGSELDMTPIKLPPS